MDKLTNGYLMNYLNNNILLVKTMTFKFHDVARLVNEGVRVRHPEYNIDINSPETWKYYLNIIGEYHSTDTMMRVISVDTLREIDFTKENLAIHTATASAYKYGTRLYYELVLKYPYQENLVNGILVPATMSRALAAEDGEIISYRTDLVEENEITLINELQQYIKLNIERYYNTQFNMSSNLYMATYLTQLYSHLPAKLLNLRLKRCHSYEVNSFHVRMYLASHNNLAAYMPYLTLKQLLWLYRNIRYIERHAGLMDQFIDLIEHILSERGIPVSSFSIRHRDSYEGYQPDIFAKSHPLNADSNRLRNNDHTVDEVYSKEKDEAFGNEDYTRDHLDEDKHKFRTNTSASVMSKVLHSTMVDYSDSMPETYEEVTLRQWCYMANRGLYDAYIEFKDPKTSLVYSLHAKDAFFYMFYLSLKMDGFELHTLPQYLNMQQRKHPKPTIDDLLSVVDYKQRDLRYYAELILRDQPVIQMCYSTSSFHDHVETIYEQAYWHNFLISGVQDYYERALVENMVRRLYEDERIEFNLSSTYTEEWRKQQALPEYNYTRYEAKQLIKNIYEAGSGLVIYEHKQLKYILKALTSLFKQLSSYTIQFVTEINQSNMIVLNWPAIRFGNQRIKLSHTQPVDTNVLVYDYRSQERFSIVSHSTPSDRIDGFMMKPHVENVSLDVDLTSNIRVVPIYSIVKPLGKMHHQLQSHVEGNSSISINQTGMQDTSTMYIQSYPAIDPTTGATMTQTQYIESPTSTMTVGLSSSIDTAYPPTTDIDWIPGLEQFNDLPEEIQQHLRAAKP